MGGQPTVPRDSGKIDFQYMHFAQISTCHHQRVMNRIWVDNLSQNQLVLMTKKIRVERFQIFNISSICFAYQN
jgi:hypothetical protein